MNIFKKTAAFAMAAVLLVGGLAACGKKSDAAATTNSVKIGYVNWSEGVAMTNLVAAILEDKMDTKVELIMVDAAPLFASLSSGDTDFFLDAWLPVTHESYMNQYGDKLEDLGTNFENAKLGLVVPAYLDINSIEELNHAKEQFEGKIVGIDSGAGLMSATEKAIESYGLDYTLTPGSGPTMTAALKKAIDTQSPIVVTGWAPHWKFARWELKFLEDPKGVFGGAEEIKTMARQGFSEDKPEIAEFLKKFKMSDVELGSLMGDIEDSSEDASVVARKWMAANEELVNSWLA